MHLAMVATMAEVMEEEAEEMVSMYRRSGGSRGDCEDVQVERR